MHRIDPSIHLLLVEDDAIDILHMKFGLREKHVINTLDVALTATEALEKINNKTDAVMQVPRMIILDINLPKMNGFEFLKKLKKDTRYQSVPVIIVTTSSAPTDQKTADDFNVAGYFTKPLDMDKFMVLYDNLVA